MTKFWMAMSALAFVAGTAQAAECCKDGAECCKEHKPCCDHEKGKPEPKPEAEHAH
jgi:hypothetical protein